MRWLRRLLDDPKFWVRVQLALTTAWAMLIVPSVIWWSQSIPWLVFMSAYANFAGSVAAWMAARADRGSPRREDIARIEDKIDALRGKINLLVVRGRS